MAIGNFLGKFKGKESVEPKKFLALILTDEVVQASVWHVAGVQTEIVAIGNPVEWDGDTGTTGELITAVDATISSAVEGLGDEPSSVILGIPHSWTDKNGVLGVKREFIGKIRKELELEAIGYVVITDSILSYLKMKEGTPTTSILIQVSRDELTLVLVRLGKIEAIETIGRSDDVVDDVTEGIARFKIVDNLPSRIILFNSMHNLDDIIQNLLSVDWPSEFNFLHIPKIESLPKDVAIRALSVAGGAEVAKSLGFTISDSTVNSPVESSNISEIESEISKDPISAEPEESEELLTAEEIGFTASFSKQKSSSVSPFIDPDDEPEVEQGNKSHQTEPKKHQKNFVMPKFHFPKVHLPRFKLSLSSTKPLWWFLIGGLLILGVIAYWLIWILPSADVMVKVAPKMLEETVQLTLSTTDSSINFSDRIVPAEIETISQDGEKMMETTGTKIIGDPAKGEVTLYNKTSHPKTFTKGTSLSSGSLKFTLDSDITVASSSSTTEGITFGKNNIAITASAIGKDSNLPSGTEFTVMSFGKDSYVGKNESDFKGGTEKTVQVVGKDDQKTLTKNLTEELLLTLTNKSIENSVSGTGIYLIQNSAKIDAANYSAKVGESAKNLKVSMTLKASLLKYKTDDVTNLVNSSIDQDIPSGYVRSNLPSTVDLSASNVDESGATVTGSAKVKVSLLPVLDHTMLQTSLKGKKGSALENFFSTTIPGYQSAEVQILPSWIPARLKSIPLNPDHITIQIMAGL